MRRIGWRKVVGLYNLTPFITVFDLLIPYKNADQLIYMSKYLNTLSLLLLLEYQ
jgi:hypothetical protein